MKLTKTCLFLSAMTAMLIGLAGSASAQTAGANLPITASVAKSCTIVTAPVSFGAYSPLSGSVKDANGSVTITCTKGAGTSIELGQGLNSNRTMSDGSGNFLTYELHQGSVTGATWAAAPDQLVSGAAPDMLPRPFTVYGRIPANQVVPDGNYSDTVIATVNF
jgi:spore coat protein U-like protein